MTVLDDLTAVALPSEVIRSGTVSSGPSGSFTSL